MEEKTKKHVKIIVVSQIILLAAALIAMYFLYPRTDFTLEGTLVRFSSLNANVIIISENPDFSNPRYLDFGERNNLSFDLKPGKYYWKASNNFIEGLKKEFVIQSEVGMKVDIKEGTNQTRLANIGNVKINVTKNKQGMMVGYIILDANQSEEIENSGIYTGRENGN